ncbi:MAG: glycosyltransferase family 4 protein [Desulfuromonadaceae bacterium]
MKKRVGLFLAIEPTWGGAFQYDLAILDAVEQLPREEIDVVVGYSHPSWVHYLEQYNFKNVCIPLGYWGRFFGQLLHCSGISTALWRAVSPVFHPTVRALLREKCDVWIFPSQDPWGYLAPVPALNTIHDLMHRYERRFPEIGTCWQYAWREWHFKNTCRWSDGILVDSQLGKQHVIDSYQIDPSRIHVLPFIAPSYLDDKPLVETTTLKTELPKKFLFYPAQFWEHKNHKRLVKAVHLLKYRFPEIKLVLTGAKKNEYAIIQKLCVELALDNDVIFLDHVSDSQMALLYRDARAMIMPTFSGPTNIPPLEAMKSGCPAAVSNIYAMPEQTKGAALLFDPESVDDMASAMAKLWEDDNLCRDLSERGKEVSLEWTKEHFDALVAEILMSQLRLNGSSTR